VAQNFGCSASIRENVTIGFHSFDKKKKTFFYSEEGGSRLIKKLVE